MLVARNFWERCVRAVLRGAPSQRTSLVLPSRPIRPRDSEGAIMKCLVARLWANESGEDLTEYALLLVMLSLAAVSGMNSLANGIKGAFSNAAVSLNAAT